MDGEKCAHRCDESIERQNVQVRRPSARDGPTVDLDGTDIGMPPVDVATEAREVAEEAPDVGTRGRVDEIGDVKANSASDLKLRHFAIRRLPGFVCAGAVQAGKSQPAAVRV